MSIRREFGGRDANRYQGFFRGLGMFGGFMQTKMVTNLAATLALLVAPGLYAQSALKAGDMRGSSLQLASAPIALAASQAKVAGSEALTMVSADLNADGYADLVSGYSTANGGYLSIHRANQSAYAPSTSAELADLREGMFPSPFAAREQIVKLPVSPDFAVAADLNGDGDADLLVAKKGDSALYFIPGSHGNFGKAERIELPAQVDALALGEIDFPNAAADLAVAISGAGGSKVLIYRDGIGAKPSTVNIGAPADQIEIGNFDGNLLGDIALLSAGKLTLVHGNMSGASRAVEALSLDLQIAAFASGDFIWDRDGKTEFALLQRDGSLAIATQGALNTTPYSVEEARAKRRAQHALESSTTATKAWSKSSPAWSIAERSQDVVSKASVARGVRLIAAKLSLESAYDLLVLDTLNASVKIWVKEGAQRKSYTVTTDANPVALLVRQTSAFVLPSLIVLSENASAPVVLPSQAKATFTVSKTTDTADGTCNADCSLREAITAANGSAGADSIVVPAGTYELTRTNAAANEDNNSTGDLDILDNTTITGAGSASTIIQAGTTNANGIDKVLAFNPICTTAVSSSISGVTVRFGRNTQSPTAPDFSYTGGGVDVCNTGAGNFSATDLTVTDNSATTGYGGGVNFDSVTPANGSFTMTNSTVSNNRTTSTNPIVKNGGGINLFGDQHNVTLTNVSITGNTSAADGGGVYARHTNGGAILLQTVTISNNTSASRGGGVANNNFGTATLTLNNDGVVSGNVSQGTTAGTESRGGGIYSGASGSTTINEMTITGNQASTGTSQLGGGVAVSGGAVTLTFNRITGNTAGTGSGSHNSGGNITGTRNWWGCNAGPGAAPCDRAVNASGTTTTTPHLILTHTASPTSIVVGQTSTLTAHFLSDSAAGAVAVANLDALIGTTHAFSGASLGTLSGAQTQIQAGGNATATFTGTSPGAGGANSVVDSHTQNAAITIAKANTTTTITADLPDPSLAGVPFNVNYGVAIVSPGAGTLTGNVVVTASGGAETCTGTVAAGTCSLTLTVGGMRTLTATYSGDTNFNGSADTEPHEVTVCPSTVVTNGNDSGAGSLRDILANACEPSTVTFQAGVTTVTLTSAQLLLNKDVTINGGTGVTVARSSAGGTPNFRIFTIASGKTVNMSALRISNGNHPVQAGGVENNGTLSLNNVEISGNRAPQSGGIQNNNVLTLSNSTISGNTATLFAGGLGIFGPTTTLTNCTISGNQADSDTGGIGASGNVVMTNCTVANNSVVISAGVGAGITVNAANVTLRNSIVAGNRRGDLAEANIDGTVQAASAFNLIGVGPAGGLTNGVNNNVVGAIPAAVAIGTLGNYGGITPTLPLLPGSLAINAGSNSGAPGIDQRGIVRPQQTTTDMGAYESGGFTLALSGGNNQTTVVSTPFANPLAVTVAPVAVGEPVEGGRVTFTVPGAGASATLATNPATINASGVASTTATANGTVGSYTVGANTAGNAGSALSYSLQNRALSADVGITKTDGVTTAVPGNSVTYTIVASNSGLDATSATVVDTFPAVLTCTWTCVGAGSGTCPASGSGNINASVSLPVGGTTTFTANCAIAASATGSLTNTATVSSAIDTTPGNNSATDTDTLTPRADLAITKTDGVTSVFAGGSTTYTITASNSGPSNAPGSTVADTFPASLTCTWTCVGAGGTCTASGSGNINDTVNLSAGGSVTYTASCNISPAATGTLSNTATVAAPAGVTDPTPGNNTATDTDTINALPTLTVNDVSIGEGNGGTTNLIFTVTRNGLAAGAVGFNYATADGTATTADNDYVATSGTGTIPAGGATGTTTVTVVLNGDLSFENNETLFLNLSAPTGATIADNQGVGTINNDDTTPTLTINDVAVTEGNLGTQAVVFTVTRTGTTSLPVAVNFATSNGTATAGSDYVAASGALNIPAGGATGTATVSVTVNGDSVVEANETYFVNLSGETNSAISDGQGLGTINNDDTAGIVLTQSGGSTDVVEGGLTDTYTLVLTSQPTSDVTITLAPNAQVTATPSPITFTSANWNVARTVTVTAVDDAVVEGNHTGTIGHTVASSDSSYNAFALANLTVNITDNDLPTLTIDDVSVAEGNGGTSTMTFTVTRTGATPSTVSVTYATTDGTATTGNSDYDAASGTVSIPSGGASASTTISVTVFGDVRFENNEIFTVNLSSPSNAAIADAIGIGTITNDDTAPTLAVDDVSITEGNTGNQVLNFTVTRTGLTDLPADYSFATANGTATAGSDYVAINSTGSIAAGGATGTAQISVQVNGDAVVEADETFTINLTVPVNSTLADAQGVATILNDDTAGIVLTQSLGSTDVTEGGATDTYTLVLTSQPTSNVVIALNPGTQLTTPASVTFTAGNWNVAQTVTVAAVDDVIIEGNHTGTIVHTVTSADPVYNAFVVTNVVANITDNDLPTLSINDVSINEGNSGTSILSFTVTRTGATPSAVGFDFATADGTATTADSDYVSTSGTGTIPSGGASATTTISVTINGDDFFENNESLSVNLSAPSNALIADGQGVGTITNDDAAPTLSIDDVTVFEGNSGNTPMVFTVTRSGLTKVAASVNYATANDTATAGTDYTAATGTATIAANTAATATTTITVQITGDNVDEPTETLFVNLTTSVASTIADPQGVGTITNDDGPPTFTPAAPITRQQGSPAAPANLGTVSDQTDPAGSLTVALVGGTATGVNVTGLANTGGTVSANLEASCSAASGTLRIRVTDSNNLTDTQDVQVDVTANTGPTLSYAPINIGVGNGAVVNPSAGPSDNGSITSIAVQSVGTYTGSIAVSTAGVITLSNATPAGAHDVVIRATDNCGANTDFTVKLNVAQATTIKEVTSNVSPSRFGQVVTFSAQLSGVNPTGSVEFFNGATSLGTAPLTPSPSGGNNLKLASLSTSALPIGNSNITVSYPGDTNNLPSTSSILVQTVQAGDTRVVVSPATNPGSVGANTINVQVSAIAPAVATVAGSVTLTAGSQNCTATITAGSGSCVLNFATPGFYVISASYTPANSTLAASTGAGSVVVLSNPSSTDLRVRIGNGLSNVGIGQLVRYDIVVDNLGTQAAVGRLQVPVSADLSGASFTCVATGDASCGALSGTGGIDQNINLAPGGVVIYSLLATTPIDPERLITQTASITPVAPTTDTDLTNNTASDSDPMGLLSDGFESLGVGE